MALTVIGVMFSRHLQNFDILSFEDSFKLSILTLTNTVNSALFGLDYLTFFDLKI